MIKDKQDNDPKKESATTISADEVRLFQLKKKLSEERANNIINSKKRAGEKVAYGDEIILVHYDSGMLLEASKTCAEFDKSCNNVKLTDQGSKGVYFIIEPRYKYRSEG